MIRIKENMIRSEQYLRTQVTKIMQHHLEISMHLIEDRDFGLMSKVRMMVGGPCNVGLMEESITREIVHSIKAIERISIVLRRHR